MRALNEEFLKMIPGVVLLFCVLEIFELLLIINDLNKTEKIETQLRQNLEVSKDITILLKKYLDGMQLERFENKKIKIK